MPEGFTPIMGNVSNFGFMNNPMLMDPGIQSAMARQMYAQSLLGLGTETTPLRSPWQGAARAVQGLLGGFEMGQSQQLLEDYAQKSREAAAEQYRQIPTPQLPPTPGMTTTTGGPQPQVSNTKEAVLGQIMHRESGGQNVETQIKDPNTGKPASSASGYYQITDSNWQNFAPQLGIDTKQFPRAMNASFDQQHAVASKMYDVQGTQPWSASAPPGGYGGGGGGVGGGGAGVGGQAAQTVADAAQAAAAYGVQMSQQYRQLAINAAQSPYAAVRAMAPQFMQQSLGFLQYGRYTPVGYNPDGQMLMLDRMTSKVEAVGAPVSLHAVPGGALGTATGQIVYPSGYQPIAGGGPGGAAGGGEQGGVNFIGSRTAAHQNGVPTSPGNPYQNMPADKQQELLVKERDQGNANVTATDPDATAAQEQIRNIQRLRAIIKENEGAFGSSVPNRLAREYARQTNQPWIHEFENLSAGMIAPMRLNSGINRVTNMDMAIFETMAPHENVAPEALNNILDAAERKAQLALEHNRFLHDYVDANGTMRGAEGAWDAYINANPVFKTDPQTGNYTVNKDAMNRREWFRANTDEGTGLLKPGSRAATGTQPGRGATGKVTTQGTDLPDVTKYPVDTVITDDATGKSYRSNGKTWVPQ